MSDILLGAPSKAKAIYDALLARLASTRAARIDYLTGPAALASTAVSTANATSARAAKLDNIDVAVSEISPWYSSLEELELFLCQQALIHTNYISSWSSDVWDFFGTTNNNPDAGWGGISAANTWATILNVTSGSGAFIGAIAPHGGATGVNVTQDIKVTIDGVAKTFSITFNDGQTNRLILMPPMMDSENQYPSDLLYNQDLTLTSGNSVGAKLLRYYYVSPPQWHRLHREGVRYESSLKVEVRCSHYSTTNRGHNAAYFYAPDNYGGT